MLIAVDVHYGDDGQARAAAIVFDEWTSSDASDTEWHVVTTPAEYESGALYRRELPCILPLIESLRARYELDWVIVDAYVDLASGPGLGRHLFEALEQQVDVVGVAKSANLGAPAREVVRGSSHRPLYVSATRDLKQVCEWVRDMAGDTRIPTLLQRVDHLARGI